MPARSAEVVTKRHDQSSGSKRAPGIDEGPEDALVAIANDLARHRRVAGGWTRWQSRSTQESTMKKFVIIPAALLRLVALVGCGNQSASKPAPVAGR